MISPELLRRYPFFGGLSEEQLKRIAMISEVEDYEVDEYILEEGNEADALFVVVEGEVAILINIDEEGEMEEELSSVPAGAILAWSALVAPHTLTASAVAAKPTKVIAIDGEGMRNLFEEDCRLGYVTLSRLVSVMRERLASTRTQLASMVC